MSRQSRQAEADRLYEAWQEAELAAAEANLKKLRAEKAASKAVVAHDKASRARAEAFRAWSAAFDKAREAQLEEQTDV